jgi:hypothetical protein
MRMKWVDSSILRCVGYDAKSEVLRLEFHNGSFYDYHGVPLFEVKRLLRSPSLGQYYNQNIRDRYPFTRYVEAA